MIFERLLQRRNRRLFAIQLDGGHRFDLCRVHRWAARNAKDVREFGQIEWRFDEQSEFLVARLICDVGGQAHARLEHLSSIRARQLQLVAHKFHVGRRTQNAQLSRAIG